MKFLRLPAAAVAACLLFSAALRADGPETLPLPEQLLPGLGPVLQAALAQSPRVLAANLEVLQAEHRRTVDSARKLPSAGGFFQINAQRDDRIDLPGTQDTEKVYYNFNVTQPLWHWGTIEAQSEVGEIGRAIAERNLEEARRLLAIEVRDQYLNLILGKLSVRNARFAERLARESHTRREARFQRNEITPGEILNSELQRDEAVLAREQAESNFEFALAGFRRLTGLAAFGEGDVPDAVPSPGAAPALASGGVGSGYLAASALQINEMQIEQEKRMAKINRYALWPKFNAVAGLSRDELSYSSNIAQKYRTDTYFVGLQINWSVFDGFASRGWRQQSLTRIRQLERAREDLIEELKSSAERTARDVGFTWQASRHAALRARFAREGLDFARENFARGQLSQEQVDLAQNNAFNAEYLANAALVRFYQTTVRFRSLMQADPLAAPVSAR